MPIPIDVLYCDRQDRVVAIDAALKPWRIGSPHRGVHHVLELPAGRGRGHGHPGWGSAERKRQPLTGHRGRPLREVVGRASARRRAMAKSAGGGFRPAARRGRHAPGSLPSSYGPRRSAPSGVTGLVAGDAAPAITPAYRRRLRKGPGSLSPTATQRRRVRSHAATTCASWSTFSATGRSSGVHSTTRWRCNSLIAAANTLRSAGVRSFFSRASMRCPSWSTCAASRSLKGALTRLVALPIAPPKPPAVAPGRAAHAGGWPH